MLVPESKPENMNMTQKSWEALFWDIVANGISGWAQLLMDASLWLTALIQVRESESDDYVLCILQSLWSSMFSVMGSSTSLICCVWVQTLHHNKGSALTPSH